MSIKIAYLILCHKDPEFVKRTALKLTEANMCWSITWGNLDYGDILSIIFPIASKNTGRYSFPALKLKLTEKMWNISRLDSNCPDWCNGSIHFRFLWSSSQIQRIFQTCFCTWRVILSYNHIQLAICCKDSGRKSSSWKSENHPGYAKSDLFRIPWSYTGLHKNRRIRAASQFRLSLFSKSDKREQWITGQYRRNP